MLKSLGRDFYAQMIREGVYIAQWDYNFDHELISKGIVLKSNDSKPIVDDGERYIDSYGVCDSYKQILDLIPELLNSEKKYVIGLTLVEKEHEPETEGWTWHKWGEYIGTQSPQCEYIYDEPEIEQVYFFEVYEV